MKDDIILNKIVTIKRCIKRIEEVYEGNEENLYDFTKQDSIVLIIQRACEASIDMAMHIVSKRKLGIPQNSRESFSMLLDNGYINKKTTQSLKSMVGFRNIAVHDYRSLQIDILKKIIENHLTDFVKFIGQISNISDDESEGNQ